MFFKKASWRKLAAQKSIRNRASEAIPMFLAGLLFFIMLTAIFSTVVMIMGSVIAEQNAAAIINEVQGSHAYSGSAEELTKASLWPYLIKTDDVCWGIVNADGSLGACGKDVINAGTGQPIYVKVSYHTIPLFFSFMPSAKPGSYVIARGVLYGPAP